MISLRPSTTHRAVYALLLSCCAVVYSTHADTRRLDCFPDRVVEWNAAEPNPEFRFGAAFLPGIILGPPGDSSAVQGSLSVASTGWGGSVQFEFTQTEIFDGPGPDFSVFENSFFVGAPPASASADYALFAEPAFVEVSESGQIWHRFPYDAAALQAMADAGSAQIFKPQALALIGLAGIQPTTAGNYTIADDPFSFDASGVGGLSGAGGDSFDLSDVGLASIRFIRLIDSGIGVGFPGTGEGFDLDAVVAHHARPLDFGQLDTDGDGLSDAAELELYGTDPVLKDSDGDGGEDGQEVASCRDPMSSDITPVQLEPRLWLDGAACTTARWSFVDSGMSYDIIRGDLDQLSSTSSQIELGATTCLGSAIPTVRWECDASAPLPDHAFFFLVRLVGDIHAGRGSPAKPRFVGSPCL